MYSPLEQKKIWQKTKALGESQISSEYVMVPHGFEDIQFLTKDFIYPVINPEGVIDVYMQGGIVTATPEIAKINFRGTYALKETVRGAASKFLEQLQSTRTVVNQGNPFDFDIYQGNPEKYTSKLLCYECIIFGIDGMEVSYENKSQLAYLQGQMSYNYFGEREAGNL